MLSAKQTSAAQLGLGALAGAAIALSTALVNVSVVLLVLLGAYLLVTRPPLARAVARSPFVWGSVALWSAFLVGMFYTQASSADAWRMLGKMRVFALMPFVFAAFSLLNVRRGALWGFALAAGVSVVATYVLAAWGIELNSGTAGSPSYSPFHSHTYHNLYAALLVAGLLALLLTRQVPVGLRLWAVAAIAVSVASIFLLVIGRGGQIGLLMLVCTCLVVWRPKRGLVAVAGVLTAFALLVTVVPRVQERFTVIGQQVSDFQQGKTSQVRSSAGERLTFWSNGIKILKRAPLQGFGTGTYGQLYASTSGNWDVRSDLGSRNPHNDYLWITVELGLIGAVALLAMLAGAAITAWRAPLASRMLALAWLVTMALGCLFNSYLTDNLGSHGFIVIMCCLCASGNNLHYENNSEKLG